MENPAINFTAQAVGYGAKGSTTLVASTLSGLCTLEVLQPASAKTVSFAATGGLTAVKTMGEALLAGAASKLVIYNVRIDGTLAKVSNGGKEV